MADGFDFTPGQAEKRRTMVFTDQHGRNWSASIELRTGFPVGSVVPLGFEPKLAVDQKYMKFFRNRPGYMEIDYDSMLNDLTQAEQIYKTRLQKAAEKHYGDRAGEALKKPSQLLLDTAGTPPAPKERILAAKAGNQWVLGLSDLKPAWAEKIFPEPAPAPEVKAEVTEQDKLREMFPDVVEETQTV